MLLVFGGSLGARALNELAVEAFGEEGPAVGCTFRRARLRVAAPPRTAAGGTGSSPSPPTSAPRSARQILRSRAPAGRSGSSRPPGCRRSWWSCDFATGDHQTKNARHFERLGGAVVVPEAELDAVPALVRALLQDAPWLTSMKEAMRRLARPDAADTIAEELIGLAATRG